MRRYLRPSAINDPVSAWGLYKSDDDQTYSDDWCCDLCCPGGRRGRNLARAGAAGLPGLFERAGVLSADRLLSPRFRQAGFRRAGRRRRAERSEFDGVAAARLVLSPDDPRYGRPMNVPPVYSDRAMPTGPVLSPDDPRYGRPMNAPPVYSDRAMPTGPIVSPDDPRYGRPAGPPPQTYSDRGMRPPEGVGAPGGVTGAVQPASFGTRWPARGVVCAAGR